jgi:hypothetical protein
MRSITLRSFALLVIAILAHSPAHSQIVAGVAGLNVKLCDNDGKTIATSVSGDDGSWSFAVPISGEFAIVVEDHDLQVAREVMIANDGALTMSSITFEWTMADNPLVECHIGVRDSASGLPTGALRYAPVQFVRELDRSTPLLKVLRATNIKGTISYATRQRSREKRH